MSSNPIGIFDSGIGGLTIASEFDSRSPYYQAQASAVDHNKLKHSTQKERIKAGITKH